MKFYLISEIAELLENVNKDEIYMSKFFKGIMIFRVCLLSMFPLDHNLRNTPHFFFNFSFEIDKLNRPQVAVQIIEIRTKTIPSI